MLLGRTHFSLRYGVWSPESLVAQAQERGYETLALTDCLNTSAFFDVLRAGKEQGVKVLPGLDWPEQHLTFVALSNAGLLVLHEWFTERRLGWKSLPAPPPLHPELLVLQPARFLWEAPNAVLPQARLLVEPRDLIRLNRFPHLHHLCLASNFATVANPLEADLHRHLRAIDENALLTQLSPEMTPGMRELLLPKIEWEKQYQESPWLVEQWIRILEPAHYEADLKSGKTKKVFTQSSAEDRQLLHDLCLAGLVKRYSKTDGEPIRRLQHELEVIERLGFVSYFLIAWDIVQFARSKGFYHVGRGSGANTISAYCLGITDVDPIELDLYFERFLNPKRSSPPDFDLDFSWKDRDEVFAYIFERHGRRHTALLGTVSTFREASWVRELGKVYGLPKEDLDRFADHPERLPEAGEIGNKILSMGNLMADFPNHRSIHAGGVLISDAPIFAYSALDMPPKGFATVQWDMYLAESIGFEKFDILSQRGIGHIQDAAALVLQNKGIAIDVHQVAQFKQDERVKAQLASGNTIGCFYIESPAMRGLLKKLRCSDYLTLVAASSIIRPGVARSGMMKAYIERFHHPERVVPVHPILGELLAETYGVMVYQEDVLKVCHHFAGLDLADADILRRAMSGKHRSKDEFKRIVDRFFDNCRQRGYPDEVAAEVWRQIESFAGYSFSKAHSASYAVESFQSLFLKAYYPLEFMVAVVNNFGGFYSSWVYLQETKRAGGELLLPCLNHSNWLTSLSGTKVWMGFIHVAGLEFKLVERILQNRGQDGAFVDLNDLLQRVPMHLEQAILLVRVGALRFTRMSKKELMWALHLRLGTKPQEPQPMMFQAPVREYALPNLDHTSVEDAYDELELIGFPLTLSEFDLLHTAFRGSCKATELAQHIGREVRMVGNLVTTKGVRTVRGELMRFGTFLDVDGQFFDTVHFPPSLKQNPFSGRGVYLIKGKVVEEFGFPSLEVTRMAKLPWKADPRFA